MRLSLVLLLGVGSVAVLSTGCSDLTRPTEITIDREPMRAPVAPAPVAAVTPPTTIAGPSVPATAGTG
jgi:hypothetical protein